MSHNESEYATNGLFCKDLGNLSPHGEIPILRLPDSHLTVNPDVLWPGLVELDVEPTNH